MYINTKENVLADALSRMVDEVVLQLDPTLLAKLKSVLGITHIIKQKRLPEVVAECDVATAVMKYSSYVETLPASVWGTSTLCIPPLNLVAEYI